MAGSSPSLVSAGFLPSQFITESFVIRTGWYDNASTKPLPGQHRLRDSDGEVITAIKAAEDRKLKEKLKFTGLTGRKNRLSFKTVNNAAETVPLSTQYINPLTGEREPWKESPIKVDRIPDFSAATAKDWTIVGQQKRYSTRPRSILVDGKKVKPQREFFQYALVTSNGSLNGAIQGTTRMSGVSDLPSSHSPGRLASTAR